VQLLARRRLTFDRRLYQLVNRLPHTRRGDLYIAIVSDLGEGIGWAAAGIWLAYLDGRRGRRAAVAASAAAWAATTIAQRGLKPIFHRRRPFTDRAAIVVGTRMPDHSFPSGHTAASFAAATALGREYPTARVPLLLTASGVGVSRVHLGHHFPTDVLAGAALGTAVGWVSSQLARTVSNGDRPRTPRRRAAARRRRASEGSTTGEPSPPAAGTPRGERPRPATS
jgi:undecaprenyl-diphosphatase